MQRILFMLVMALCSLTITAQGNKQKSGRPASQQFDPKKFETGLEQHVMKVAGITQAESARFLVVYREKRKKELAAMGAMRQHRQGRPTSEKEWAESLKAHDNMEIQLKKIQQDYHNKMLRVIPASKVVKVVMAEEQYHRDAFGKMHERMMKQGANQNNGHRFGGHHGRPQKK